MQQQQLPHTASKRWLVDISAWQPSSEEILWIAGILPKEDASACLAYCFEDDKKRALASRLLARRCCSDCLGIPWSDVLIKRTRGRKPFCANSGAAVRERRHLLPNFNFNISHEGDYVALASDPHCIVGVDVAAPQQIRRRGAAGPLLDSLRLLRGQLTGAEWARISGLAGDEAAMEAAFQGVWGCKEAFVKARGDGLGFDPLSRIHVDIMAHGGGRVAGSNADGGGSGDDGKGGGANGGGGGANGRSGTGGACAGAGSSWTDGTGGGAAAEAAEAAEAAVSDGLLTVDGVRQLRWRVLLHRLPRRHWAAVALAPPEQVVDAFGEFTATLLQPTISDADMARYLSRRAPAFELLRLEDLLPCDLAAEYKARFGD